MCQARFRGVSDCSRCGADLSQIMRIAAEAWRLRESARQALLSGAFERAAGLAVDAQAAHATPAGDALRRLGEWLRVGTALSPE